MSGNFNAYSGNSKLAAVSTSLHDDDLCYVYVYDSCKRRLVDLCAGTTRIGCRRGPDLRLHQAEISSGMRMAAASALTQRGTRERGFCGVQLDKHFLVVLCSGLQPRIRQPRRPSTTD